MNRPGLVPGQAGPKERNGVRRRMCEQQDGKIKQRRKGEGKRRRDTAQGRGGKRVCALSASSRLFSECHSLFYQSKVRVIRFARALHAAGSSTKAPFTFLAFPFCLLLSAHSDARRSLMSLSFCTPNWRRWPRAECRHCW